MDLDRLKIDKKAKGSHRRGGWLVPATVGLVVVATAWLIAGDRIADFVASRLGSPGLTVETVRAQRVSPTAGVELTTASGYIVPRKTASLGSKVLGRLAKLYVEPGDRVEEHQIVAELEHEDLDAAADAARADVARAQAELTEAAAFTKVAELDEATAEAATKAAAQRVAEVAARLAEAKRELVRAKALLEGGDGSVKARDLAATEVAALGAQQETLAASLEQSKARTASAAQETALRKASETVKQRIVKTLEARRVQSEALRDDAFIRAPFEGVILRKEAEVGEIVAPSPGGSTLSRSAVLTMADFRTLEMEVDVFERDIHLVREKGPAQIRLDAYPDTPREGHVRLILPTADRQKATVQVKVVFERIPDFARPEMAGTVVFLEPGKAARAEQTTRILVPAHAVSGNRVWLVRNGRALPVEVRLGPRRGTDVEVVEGLSGGETLIASKLAELSKGMRIVVRKEQ